jgi:hypothetical protein
LRLDRTVLRVDRRKLTFGEGLLAGRLGGADRSAFDRLARRVACTKLAEAEGVGISHQQRQRGFDAWRRRRGLISGDDYRDMLSEWDVDRAVVLAYIDRCLCFDVFADRLEEALRDHEPQLAEALFVLPDELLFEGEWGAVVESVALHLVAGPLPPGEDAAVLEREILSGSGLAGRDVLETARRILGVSAEEADRLVKGEVAFRHHRRSALSHDRLERELRRRGFELETLQLHVVRSDDLDVANELRSCVTLDGEPLERVAARTGLSCEREVVLFKDLKHSTLGLQAAGTPPRGAIGPIAVSGGFAVGQLLERLAPTLDRPEVRSFLEDRLIRRELGPEVARRVRVVAEMGP